MKQCKGCNKIKPNTEFYTRPGSPDGYRNFCKDCMHKTMKKYQQEHLEEKHEYNRAYRQDHLEVLREYSHRYWQEHRETHRKYCLAYRREHLQEERARGRAYAREHPEKYREKAHLRRARKRNAEVEKIDDRLVFQQARYRCAMCDRKTKPDYNYQHRLYPTLDHIIPLARGGTHTWLNVQCLCRECNIRKHTSVKGQQLKLLA